MPIMDFPQGPVHRTSSNGRMIPATRWSLPLRALRQRDQVRRQADRARGADGGLHPRRPACRHLSPPGLYMLETNNMPIMTSLQSWDHGFALAVQVPRSIFVSTARFTDLKWGTKNPIMLRDPEFGPTRIRAFGTYTVRVGRCGPVHDRDRGHRRRVHHRRGDEPDPQHHRAAVQPRRWQGSGIPVLDMAANTGDFGKIVADRIFGPHDHEYGLTLPRIVNSRTSRCRPRWEEASGQAHPRWGVSGRPGSSTPSSRRRGDARGGREPRRRGRQWARGPGWAWAWRWHRA